ncbi:hypothetical protein ACROYT_G015907 [Oculina patagonica]
MKLSTQYIFGFIVLGLGTAFLLSVAWPQTLTKLRSIYCRDDLGKLELKLKSLYNNVETFVIFVGYPRSSHSLIAAILDSHPEIIIPNEFDLLKKFNSSFMYAIKERNRRKLRIFFELHSRSREQAMFGRRSPNRSSKKYWYHIPGSWQGNYKNQLKVIGDKKGGGTTGLLDNPEGLQDLQQLQKTVVVPIKLIHVIRNPFDNIATICLKRLQQRTLTNQHILHNATALDFCIKYYFNKSRTVQKLHEMSEYQILDVYSRDLLTRPRETLQKLCDFLGVTCYNEFVELTLKVLHSKPSKTRYSVEWTNEQIERVTNEINKYQFLKSFFSFDSD